MIIVPQPLVFEWDDANRIKNVKKHNATNEECEEIFFDPRKKIAKDILHSRYEDRYILIGETKKGRILFIVFTIRKTNVRVISARDLNRKERILYEKET